MSKIIYQKTLDQCGDVVESWAFVDDKGRGRYCTNNKIAWIRFCQSAGIEYIEKLEVKGNGISK